MGEVVVTTPNNGGCKGLLNLIVSSSGAVTGTYLDIDGCMPTSPTYVSGGTTYTNFPVSVTMFSTTQY